MKLPRLSLLWKMIVAFLLVALTSAALVAVFIRLTSAERLGQLLIEQQRDDMLTVLTEYYETNGSWSGVATQWPELLRAQFQSNADAPPPQGEGGGNPPPDQRGRWSMLGLADSNGVVIISIDPQYPEGSLLPAAELANGSHLTVDGGQVGTLLLADRSRAFNPAEDMFLRRTNEALLLAALAALVVALIIGAILARTLIRPLRALTSATHRFGAGQLEQEVQVAPGDEIGELAEAFNRMSQQVSQANRLRKQMTADIAHDLRTPLTVIAGYIESMRDGVLQPTPERLALIYGEIEGLQNLVADLRMLSQVDAGELPLHLQPVAADEMLEHAAAPFRHLAEKNQVTLELAAEENLPTLRLDEARMMQVYGNLLSNALRYTPAGGTIRLAAARRAGALVLEVSDNGSGIVEDELPFIFDRFHRADKSRHAEAGETGLGLAIVKALVEAQHGTIQVRSRPAQGAVFEIVFPIE